MVGIVPGGERRDPGDAIKRAAEPSKRGFSSTLIINIHHEEHFGQHLMRVEQMVDVCPPAAIMFDARHPGILGCP
jgi:hypothetical protein